MNVLGMSVFTLLLRLFTPAGIFLCLMARERRYFFHAEIVSQSGKMRFNKNRWASHKKLDKRDYHRILIVQDLIDRYLNIGKDLDSVIDIVGRPDIVVPQESIKIPLSDKNWKKVVCFIAYRLEPKGFLKRNNFEQDLILGFDLEAKLCWRGVIRRRPLSYCPN